MLPKSKISLRTRVFAVSLFIVPLAMAEPKLDELVVAPVIQDAKYVVSPQGHLAAIGRKGSRMMVVVDGAAGPKVDEVVTPTVAYIDPRPVQMLPTSVQQDLYQSRSVIFSKDGGHFAYVGRIGQDWILYEDHKEVLRLPVAGSVGAVSGLAGSAGNTDIRLQFAGDNGQHLFFAKSSFAGYELWVDAQKQPGYFGSGGGGTAGTTDPLITPDGEHFAYPANLGTHPDDKHALIIDGKEVTWTADNLQYTFDGKHLVGIGRDKDGDHLIVDGKSLFAAKGIYAVYLTRTGSARIAVTMRHENPNGSIGQFLWVNGKPVEATLCETIKQVTFSPDGKRYAAICGRSGAEWVVIDGKKGQEYQFIDPETTGLSGGIKFSADSSKVGYVANASGKKFVVINEDESDAYDNAAFMFMPEANRTITFGRQNGQLILNIDGKVIPLPGNQGVQLESFVFSPDHLRYAFVLGGNRDGGEVYLDGKDTGLSGNVNFSPDSKRVCIVGYSAATNKKGIFIDGTLVAPMEQSMPYRAFSADSQHLFWMNLEPVANPTTDAFEFVTYADGKPIAHHDRGPASQALLFPHGFGQFATPPATWTPASDGALALINPTPDGIKRLKATPGTDTSLDIMIQSAKDAEAKGKAKR
jgi:hypothetical protein